MLHDRDIYHPIRCDNAGENGSTRLASIRCAGGLAFDIIRQTCDWRSNVKNCDQNESKLVLIGYYCCFFFLLLLFFYSTLKQHQLQLQLQLQMTISTLPTNIHLYRTKIVTKHLQFFHIYFLSCFRFKHVVCF